MVLAALAAFAGQAAVVYKWTDADGLVHYSDQPVPGAEKIVTNGQPTLGTGAAGAPKAANAAKKPAAAPGLGIITITSPVQQQSFFGDEPIGAHLAMEPDIKPSQTITWHLSGRDLEEGANATQFTLPHLDRGTYDLSATVKDRDTGASQTTSGVTFYVRQPSLLSPEHRRP
jgi:hypothetical protein